MTREEINILQSNFHTCFDSPQGQEVLKFLDAKCSWYDSVFTPGTPEMTLIKSGRREVLATIKTILNLSTDQIAYILEQQE